VHLTLFASYLGTDLAGRYRLERLIGEGASSWVFAATDLRLEREVAVKVLKPRAEPEHSAQRARFVEEGRMLAKLAHPHVVAVHDAGETPGGDGYLVMELSQTGTLETDLTRRSVLDVQETLSLIIPLLGALACAHDRGIIHRDLKPANIALVQREGRRACAKLLDFGIARLSSHGAISSGLVGTPAYMAPEQARAEALGPPADVWSIGVVLFRCLSGRLPFEASSGTAMLLSIVQERAARIASICPGIPPRVAVALDRALEPDPTHRYPDMRTFARVLGIACRQDGVRIEGDPEPIGLPDFASWLERADLEVTQRKGMTPPSSPTERKTAARVAIDGHAPVAVAARAPRGRTRGKAALWMIAALVALGALWSTLGQPLPTRGQPSPPRSATREQPTLKPVLEAAPQHVEPISARPLPPPAADPPGPATPRLAVRRGKPAAQPATRALPSADAASATPPVPISGASDQHAEPGLITNFEW